MKTLTKNLLLATFLSGIFAWSNVFASHTAGMELFYRHLSGTTYEFTMTFYGTCTGQAAENSIPLLAKSASLGFTNRSAGTLTKVGATYSPPNLLNCTNAGQLGLCYLETVYRGQVNLAAINPANPNATDWIFYYQLCCRPGGISLPDNINAGTQYIECGLNNKDFPEGNSSAVWHNSKPTPAMAPYDDTLINPTFRTMCIDNYYTFEQTAYEYEGDSVIYSFIAPKDAGGVPATYIAPYNLANPFPFQKPTPGFNIDRNGIVDVIPIAPAGTVDNVFVISIKATELRADTVNVGGALVEVWKEVGWVTRDMTLYIDGPNTCRKDFVHPYYEPISCGDSIIRVRFRSNNTTPAQWSRVRCSTVSPDGSEFRIVDSSVTPARYLGIVSVNYNCSPENTSRIDLALSERLYKDHDYYIFLKTGSDLDVLESECGFLEPEFSSVKIIMGGKATVNIVDSNNTILPSAISVCLPQTNPFPRLKGVSNKKIEDFVWTFNGDTIPGMETDSIWAQEEGEYRVKVRDPYGCTGEDVIKVYFPRTPEIVFDLPPYCDETLTPDPKNLPKVLTLPQQPTGGFWHWEYDFGPPNGFDLIHTGDSLIPIGPGTYRLVYEDTSIAPGIPGCVSEYVFKFNRGVHPPEAPLKVEIYGDPVLCEDGGGDAILYLDEETFKPNFKAKPGYPSNRPYTYQWYQNDLNTPIVSATDTSLIRSEEGFYYVIVKDQYGCVGLDSVQIERIKRTPAFEVFCRVTGGKAGEFYWYEVANAASYEVSADNGITWVPVENTYFRVDDIRVVNSILVRAVLNNVCQISDISASYPCAADVFPPNVFTPNNDGLNDFFFVGSLDLFPDSQVKIFDRWGTVVYESADYKNDWDGGDSPEGTYYYIVNVNDPAQSVYKGVVTLLR